MGRDKILAELAKRFQKAARHAINRIPDLAAPITYVEYLEMSSGAEFRKFAMMPAITDDDINRCDLDKLSEDLQYG